MAQDVQSTVDHDVVAVPATPPPQDTPMEDSIRSPKPATEVRRISTTPPTSAQVSSSQRDEEIRTSKLASTPTTSRKNAAKDLPTVESIEHAGIEELQNIAKTLINDLTDARMTAANARLQHHLLLLETSQAAERAEIESQLSRRQVDFLRVKQSRPEARGIYSISTAVQPPVSTMESLTQSLRDLEGHCEALEEMCDKLKREKDLQAERIQSLSEHNSLLVTRIRENREHFTRIRERSPIFHTPREAYTTPRRRYSRYQDDTPAHGPFAALIAADQILSQETASVPSTPTKSHTHRYKHGHTRGAHSLSAIQTPQSKERPSTSDGFLGSQLLLSAPGSQLVNESAERERHDRDSTISVSSNDDSGNRDRFTQSQASTLAADMLRKNPGTYESHRHSQDAEKTSNLLQSKIFGNVRKPINESPSSKLKRQYGFTDSHPKSKKVRAEDKVGLGIEA